MGARKISCNRCWSDNFICKFDMKLSERDSFHVNWKKIGI